MIKKAQIRFISLTMSILLGVFGVMFLTTTMILHAEREKNIETTLDDTVKNYIYLKENSIVYKSFLVKVTFNPETNKNENIILSIDKNSFTEQEADEIIDVAVKNNFSKGKIGMYCYKNYVVNHTTLIAVTDSTNFFLSYSSSIVKSLIALSVIFVILFFIVYAVSFKIFKPVKDAFRSQKQFISNASHELKTPLSIISANADVIKEDSNSKWVENIKSQTERMSGLVSDMLSLAKMDEGTTKLKNERFSLSNEILNATLPFDALAFEKKKRLIVNIEPNIYYNGDKACVNQLVNILLDNAIKHADKTGEIFLELKREKNKNVLTVFNTGSNVPNSESNKIFERFYRADVSRSRETGGTGLGLSIAKSLSEINKWKIQAISVQGESMTIIVTF